MWISNANAAIDKKYAVIACSNSVPLIYAFKDVSKYYNF